MGQYYKACILKDKEQETNSDSILSWLSPNDYDNFTKLMEHSWIGNYFVGTVESLIFDNPQRVVWAGDYAEEEVGTEENLYDLCIDEGDGMNKIEPKLSKKNFRYVINHTKKLFVDKKLVPITRVYKYKNRKGIEKDNIFRIHPLPLLICEGNGQGSGDFFGSDSQELVGTWARDLISVSNKKPKNYLEIFFNLVEE